MTCLQLDKDFNLICLLLFLSNIIALSYDKQESLIFLSRVEILIHHKSLMVAQQTLMSSKVGNSFQLHLMQFSTLSCPLKTLIALWLHNKL